MNAYSPRCIWLSFSLFWYLYWDANYYDAHVSWKKLRQAIKACRQKMPKQSSRMTIATAGALAKFQNELLPDQRYRMFVADTNLLPGQVQEFRDRAVMKAAAWYGRKKNTDTLRELILQQLDEFFPMENCTSEVAA